MSPLLVRICAAFLLTGGLVLAAPPVFAPIDPQTVPCGKTLVVPVQVDGNGPMTFTVASNSPKIIPLVKTGNPYLKMSVDYPGDGGSAQPFSGDLFFQLFRDMTPVAAGITAGLAQAGFYDGLELFVVSDLTPGDPTTRIIQGGSVNNSQSGNPGFAFENEFRAPLIFAGKGQFAIANAGYTGDYTATNNSQFFITAGPLRKLDFKHTISGQLVRGFDVLAKIDAVPTINDQPTQPVTMTSVSVVQDETDAVLLVSAVGVINNATVTVTARDRDGISSAKTFNVIAVQDTVNDPPFIRSISDATARRGQNAVGAIKGQDLEFDFLSYGGGFLFNPTGASGSFSGGALTINPNPGNPVGRAYLGVTLEQLLEPVLRLDPLDRAQIIFGLGEQPLKGSPALLTSGTGVPLVSGTVATFLDLDPFATASNYIADVNWGDGSPITGGTNVGFVRAARPAPTGFSLTASHTYQRPGIYSVLSTVVDQVGGATSRMQGSAVIPAGELTVFGRSLTADKGELKNRLLATFKDAAAGTPASYSATINWGDGAISKGTIRRDRDGFGVYGTHKYGSGAVSAVDVAVLKISSAETAHGWATVTPKGVPGLDLPPFPQAHLVGQVGTVTHTPGVQPNFLTAEIFAINTGNKPSGKVDLRFFLSADQTLDGNDLPVKVNLLDSVIVKTVPPGGNVSGTLPNLRLPIGTSTVNKYLIMQINYTDPIGDHEPYGRNFVSPQIMQ